MVDASSCSGQSGNYATSNAIIRTSSCSRSPRLYVEASRQQCPAGRRSIVDGAFRVSDLSGDIYRLLIEPGSPPFTDADYIAAFYGPLGGLFNFSLLVAAGIVFRHRAELHKRLMVFSLMPMAQMPLMHLSGALVGRVPLSRESLVVGWLVVVLAIHFVPAVRDKLTRGRIHRASIWIPLLMIVWSVTLNAVVAPSALGFKVGSWLLK